MTEVVSPSPKISVEIAGGVARVLISNAAPSHFAMELRDSSPMLFRVSLPSRAYDHWAAPVDHRMPASLCEMFREVSVCPSALALLAAASSTHFPEKFLSGSAA